MNNFDIVSYAEKCGVAEANIFAEKCEILRIFLDDCNSKVNLTRLTSSSDFYIKHVADSLSIAAVFPEIANTSLSIADIGCGAGFPSLILALAFKNLKITAIDSTGKKINFVKLAAEKLTLKNLYTVHGRSIELNCKPEFRGKFDIVTARAVAPSPKIFKEASRFIKPDGKFIFYKTPDQAAQEADELAHIANTSWNNSNIFMLPGDAGERLFTVGKIIK